MTMDQSGGRVGPPRLDMQPRRTGRHRAATLSASGARQAASALVIGLAMTACTPSSKPAAPDQIPPKTTMEDAAPLGGVQASVVERTGLAASNVDVAFSAGQFLVTIRNGPLNAASHSERNDQARVIVNAITSAISGMPQFAAATSVHVNYVARPIDGGGDAVVDGIDFRKDASGLFALHTT